MRKTILVGVVISSALVFAQPKPTRTYESANVKPLILTHVQKVRAANHPPSPDGTRVTNHSIVGALDGVDNRLDGYTQGDSYTVQTESGPETYTVWTKDAKSEKVAGEREFDGECTATWTLDGTATISSSGVVSVTPSATPRAPTCAATGAAKQMPDFQKDFNKSVAAAVAAVLVAVRGPLALTAAERAALQPTSGPPRLGPTYSTEQRRPFTWFGSPNKLRVEIEATYKLDGELGVVP